MEETVTLKRQGKRYTCQHKVERRKCKHKDFILLDDVFICAKCGGAASDGPFEAQLPSRNDWRTPQPLWLTLHREYRFNVDLAADAQNTKCPVFFDGLMPETNALLNNWYGDRIIDWFIATGSKEPPTIRGWCNPPYNPKGAVEAWLTKAIEQAARGVFSVFLIPMASSVAWFNDLVVPYAEWHTFRGRIPFDDPLAKPGDERTSPKQDNLLVIYDPKSCVVGHSAVRDCRTGERLWTRPDIQLERS